LCASSDQCEYTIECADSYGDGWNNASLSIQQNGITYATVTIDNGSSYIAHVMLCDNVSSALVWNEGSFDDECSFTVKDPAGTIIYTGSNLSSGSLFTFTTDCNATPPTCDAPTNLNISDITENSATVTWTAGGSETSWKVAYKLHSASQWTENNVSQTSYTMTGLSAASNYDVRVTALCDNNLESTPASTTFTTSVGIDNLALLNSISLLPNPADKYIELRVNSPITMTEALVYNAFGQLIQTVELTDNHARIDLSEMAAGMYFVRVNGDNGSATKKFIKK